MCPCWFFRAGRTRARRSPPTGYILRGLSLQGSALAEGESRRGLVGQLASRQPRYRRALASSPTAEGRKRHETPWPRGAHGKHRKVARARTRGKGKVAGRARRKGRTADGAGRPTSVHDAAGRHADKRKRVGHVGERPDPAAGRAGAQAGDIPIQLKLANTFLPLSYRGNN